MDLTTPRPGKLVVFTGPSQSNITGIESPLSGVPGNHYRHGSRVMMRNAARQLVPAVEPLHLGIETALTLTGGSADGYSFVMGAVNHFLDSRPGKSAVIIPRGVGGSVLATQWRTSPEDPYTKRAIDDMLIGGLSANDRVVMLVYKGEAEAALGAASVATLDSLLVSWFDYHATRAGRAADLGVIVQLQSPGPVGTWAEWPNAQTKLATLPNASPKRVLAVNPQSGNQTHIANVGQNALVPVVGQLMLDNLPDW